MNETVLLIGPRANTLADMEEVINEATNRGAVLEKMPFAKYGPESVANDEADKGEGFLEKESSLV